jgi:CheY-like chemotaxis protein
MMDKYVILLEEDTDDQSLVRDTMSELDLDIPIQFFSDSEQMFLFLESKGKPSLILVDYNSAPESGIDVLKKLKSMKEFSEIPVVILSESDHPFYKNECYAHGASSFIKKPDTMEGTRKKIGTFFNYWLDVVEV